MARAGDVIVNPLTGERTRFHRPGRRPAGESVLIECWVQPGGTVADAVRSEPARAGRGAARARSARGSNAQPVVAGPGDAPDGAARDPAPALERRRAGAAPGVRGAAGRWASQSGSIRHGPRRRSRDEPQPERNAMTATNASPVGGRAPEPDRIARRRSPAPRRRPPRSPSTTTGLRQPLRHQSGHRPAACGHQLVRGLPGRDRRPRVPAGRRRLLHPRHRGQHLRAA